MANSALHSVSSRLLVLLACVSTLAACDGGGGSTGSASASASSATSNSALPTAVLTLSGNPQTEAVVGSSYQYQANTTGGGSLRFQATNLPPWLSLDAATGVLSGTPAAGDVGVTGDILITVTSDAATGYIGPFQIAVRATSSSTAGVSANQAPVISGAPVTTASVGQAYSFQPSATDPEGTAVAFSIVNRPGWASFDTRTGQLSGTPTAQWVGSYPGIVIRASDGVASTALPAFTLTVANATTTTSSGSAPLIAGAPATFAAIGSSYGFTPSASDADGDTLAFSVQNKPAWASFDTVTGRLSGTPGAGDAGTYGNIVISVSDGRHVSSLAAFNLVVGALQSQAASGTALVAWSAPQNNADGTTLTDLTGFNIYYGQDPNNLTESMQLDCSWCLYHEIDGLPKGTWYFAVRAYNRTGAEGAASALVSKTIS